MKNVRWNNIKAGHTLFGVHILYNPSKDDFTVWTDTHYCTGRMVHEILPPEDNPWDCTGDEFFFFPIQSFYTSSRGQARHVHLSDVNVPTPQGPTQKYNLHAVFRTRKQRQRYIDRILSRCWTEWERQYIEGWRENQRMNDKYYAGKSYEDAAYEDRVYI